MILESIIIGGIAGLITGITISKKQDKKIQSHTENLQKETEELNSIKETIQKDIQKLKQEKRDLDNKKHKEFKALKNTITSETSKTIRQQLNVFGEETVQKAFAKVNDDIVFQGNTKVSLKDILKQKQTSNQTFLSEVRNIFSNNKALTQQVKTDTDKIKTLEKRIRDLETYLKTGQSSGDTQLITQDLEDELKISNTKGKGFNF